MSISATSFAGLLATEVTLTEDTLTAQLGDGRTISVPLAWYPRLLDATPGERDHLQLIGNGEGIHWPDLDEDVSVENLLLGRPSGESAASLRRWLEARRNGSGLTLDKLRANRERADV
jgi:hypothetical protein